MVPLCKVSLAAVGWLACFRVAFASGHDGIESELSQTTLLAIRPSIFRDRANVTVHWDIPAGTASDPGVKLWVAVYSPSNYSLYLRYTNVSLQKYFRTTGSWTTEVLNARAPYIFRLWQGGGPGLHGPNTSKPYAKLLAVSNEILPDPLPMQVRTVLEPVFGRESALRLTWTSPYPEPVVVHFGHSNTMDRTVTSSAPTTYTLSELASCDTSDSTAKNSYFHPGFFHSVLLKDLWPGHPVYYDVGGGVITHVGVPAAGEDMKLIYAADIGIGPPTLRGIEFGAYDRDNAYGRENSGPGSGGALVLAAIAARETGASLAVFNGDLSYGCGEAHVHEKFAALVEPITSAMPTFATIGNHDFDFNGQPFRFEGDDFGDDSGGECGIIHFRRWPMPQGHVVGRFKDTLDGTVPFYSVDVGFIHFVVLLLEVNFFPGSPQHAWLEQDLSRVDRARTPFVIVTQHRHIYTRCADSAGEAFVSTVAQHALEPLFFKYGVDLNLAANIQEYERTCPLFNGTCTEGATTYIVAGSAGALPFPCNVKNPPAWSIYGSDIRHGYSRITARQRELHIEHVIADTGDVVDIVTLPSRYPPE